MNLFNHLPGGKPAAKPKPAPSAKPDAKPPTTRLAKTLGLQRLIGMAHLLGLGRPAGASAFPGTANLPPAQRLRDAARSFKPTVAAPIPGTAPTARASPSTGRTVPPKPATAAAPVVKPAADASPGRSDAFDAGWRACAAQVGAVFADHTAMRAPALAAELAADRSMTAAAVLSILAKLPSAPLDRPDRAARNPQIGPGGAPSPSPQAAIAARWDRAMRAALPAAPAPLAEASPAPAVTLSAGPK